MQRIVCYTFVFISHSGFGDIMPSHRIKAVIGLHSISEYNELKKNGTNAIDTNAPYEITFKNIVVHPEYSCLRPYNDIGNYTSFTLS